MVAAEDSGQLRIEAPPHQFVLVWLENHHQKLVVGLLMMALLVRLLIVLVWPENVLRNDAQQYVQNAQWLVQGSGYISVAHPGEMELTVPPLYPLFLAGLFKISDTSFMFARVIQALIATITCGMSYWLAREQCNGIIALMVLALVALYPPLLVWHGFLLTETLYSMLVLFLFVATARFAKNPTGFYSMLVGIVFGISLLTREILLFFPLIFFVLLYWLQLSWARIVKLMFVFLFGTLLLLFPWLWRNYQITDSFVYTSRVAYLQYMVTKTGYLSNHYQRSLAGELPVSSERQQFHQRFGSLSENLNPTFIAQHPLLFLQRMGNRFVEYWFHPNGLDSIPSVWKIGWLYSLGHALLIILATLAFGVEMLKNRRPVLLSFGLVLLMLTVLNLTTYGPNPRYNLPFLPLVFIFSASGIWLLHQRLFPINDSRLGARLEEG